MASIERRTRNGGESWYVRFKDAGGTARSRTFHTEQAAERWRAVLHRYGPTYALNVLTGETPPGSWTVGKWLEHELAQREIGSGTREGHEIVIKYLSPSLKAMRLEAVRKEDVRLWVDKISETHSPATVDRQLRFVKTAFARAVEEGLLQRNPLVGVRGPKVANKQAMTVLEIHEIPLAINATPEHYKLFVRLLFSTGLRFGEATALTVGDFNQSRRTLSITKAWKVAPKGRRELGVPKSAAGRRAVGLPQNLAVELAAHVEGKKPEDLIFVNEFGRVISQSHFYTRWTPVQAAVKEATGKHLRVHDVRHTWVTVALQNNPVHVVSKLAGHSNITVTVNTYSHLMATDAVLVADSLGF